MNDDVCPVHGLRGRCVAIDRHRDHVAHSQPVWGFGAWLRRFRKHPR